HCVSFLIALLSGIAMVSGYVEELDDNFMLCDMFTFCVMPAVCYHAFFFLIFILQFYAPWCAYCLTFESIWYEVGAELKSMGSPVNVGKIDTTVHTSMATEFNIRGYPTIKLFKGDLSFDYKGPRTKDAIIEFTNRVSGPVVRPLSRVQLFQYVMSHHDIIFIYIGGESLLKKEYKAQVLPKGVTLQDVPAIAVFKDGTNYLYNEILDGKLVAFAVVDEKNPSEKSIRYKTLMERLSTEYRDNYKSDYQFGYMDDNEYINIEMPFIIVLNMTIDGYCLPESKIETVEDLLCFLNSVLDGSAKLCGGRYFPHTKQVFNKARSTVVSMFRAAPFFSCFVFGLPVGIVLLVIWGTCTAVPADDEKPVEGATASPALDAHGKKAKEMQPDSLEKTSEAKKED
uniref:protein disulfide-isomerase n=1 Tax=Cyprinus carpio TaxID=7962 RepID=A0A8C1TRA7_CYPCA